MNEKLILFQFEYVLQISGLEEFCLLGCNAILSVESQRCYTADAVTNSNPTVGLEFTRNSEMYEQIYLVYIPVFLK
jgi:hypothetical protein